MLKKKIINILGINQEDIRSFNKIVRQEKEHKYSFSLTPNEFKEFDHRLYSLISEYKILNVNRVDILLNFINENIEVEYYNDNIPLHSHTESMYNFTQDELKKYFSRLGKKQGTV